MNIDAGTMSPTEHGQSLSLLISSTSLVEIIPNLFLPAFPRVYPGEVFVLDDGGEADLDLGNYERYLDVTLGRENNITTGKIYREVIEKEVTSSWLSFSVLPRTDGKKSLIYREGEIIWERLFK